MSNYYEILGIDKNASVIEIKKEYHKLALKYHPDKNKDADQDIFKRINEAFDVLSDENKKRDYDMKMNSPPQAMPNFMFNNFFNFTSATNLKKMDHFYNHKIKLIDVYNGSITNFNISIKSLCTACVKNCDSCQGKGSNKHAQNIHFGIFQFIDKICEECKGKGFKTNINCDVCESTSWIKKEKTINLIIPKGIENGKKFQFKEWGEQPTKLIETPGDFYIVINIEEDLNFIRNDLNLIYTVKIKLYESIIGKNIEIPYFDSPINLNINQFGIINPNKEHVILDKGLINELGKKGDMHLKFIIDYPSNNFSSQDIEILKSAFEAVKFL